MNDDVQSPRADEAEKYILGCFVRFPDRAAEVLNTQLAAADFFDPLHQRIFAAFVDQHCRGGIDPVLVGRQTDSVGELLIFGEDVTTTAHVPIEAERIIDARRKRQRIEEFERFIHLARNGHSSHDVDRELFSTWDDWRREREATEPQYKFAFADLRKQYPKLNPPVVDGLFRAGETVNIVSTSKVGKSWLGYSLALSIITGQKWLGRFDTTPGKVLLCDNELHRCTLANRIPAVAEASAIEAREYEQDLDVWPLRGNLRSLSDLAADFREVEPETYQVILLDAKYRFAIEGQSENDNASEARLYNLLDEIADTTKAAIVLVHHSTKGSQSEKRIVDVGAGAGSQSRAADCHIILREHEEPGVCVMDAALRSFAPIDPLPLRWVFPLWIPADDVDASKLKGKQTRSEQRQGDRDREGVNKIIDALRKGGPATARKLRAKTGLSRERQQRLLDLLESEGQVTTTESKFRET